MRFLNLSVKNFCSVEDAEFSLSERGIVAVVGENKDAEAASGNGSGKSTLVVDALCWVLFDRTTKGGTADSVTPGGKGKGTVVSVTFEQGGKTYAVTRHRKHKTNGNKLLISCNGEEISKATSQDTDKLLEQILGIDFDTFSYTTILGQGLMFRFSQLTDQNRKEILEGIAGSEIYEKARVAAREAVRGIQQDHGIAVSKLSQLETSLKYAMDNLASIEQMQSEADRKYQLEVSAADLEVVASEHAISVAQTDFVALSEVSTNTTAIDTFKSVEARAQSAKADAGQKLADARARWGIADRQLKALALVGPTCDKCGTMMTEAHRAYEEGIRRQAMDAAAADVASATTGMATADSMYKKIADQLYAMQLEAQKQTHVVSGLRQKLASAQQAAERAKTVRSRISKQDFSANQSKVLKDVAGFKQAIVDQTKVVADLAQKQADTEFWVNGFQDIRVAAIDSLLSFLNSRVAIYLGTLTGDDIKASLVHTDKGKIDLQMQVAGGTYLSASGGEKTKIDLALAFALHDLASQATNWSSNLLVLDEVAVFLDAVGIDRLMQLVAGKMDRLDSVFVISHDPVFEGYADSTMRVVKEGGVSRLAAAG